MSLRLSETQGSCFRVLALLPPLGSASQSLSQGIPTSLPSSPYLKSRRDLTGLRGHRQLPVGAFEMVWFSIPRQAHRRQHHHCFLPCPQTVVTGPQQHPPCCHLLIRPVTAFRKSAVKAGAHLPGRGIGVWDPGVVQEAN